MPGRNCAHVRIPHTAVPSEIGAVTVLSKGYAGVKYINDQAYYLFRPSRGSDGISLYENEDKCRKHTGCDTVVALSLAVVQ